MRRLFKKGALKAIAIYLAFTCLITTGIPNGALAYFAESGLPSFSREADMNSIQRVLESKMVSQRLSELGFSSDEIRARLDQLSDADMHRFASQLESLAPGGDAAITIISLLVIVILVLVILQLTGHKVIIK